MLTKNSSGIDRRGFMFILSSPSGAGKSTIARGVLRDDIDIKMSVSATTREPRGNEREGSDYHFMSVERFKTIRDEGGFIEWAFVFGHYYATPRAFVEETLQAGQDVLFDIDWQGTQQLMEYSLKDVVSIFILPPSSQALRSRLINRNEDSLATVERRMMAAGQEISHWPEYNYVVVNDEISDTLEGIRSILRAERQKRRRLSGLHQFVRELVDN